jgi:hypothetical protein
LAVLTIFCKILVKNGKFLKKKSKILEKNHKIFRKTENSREEREIARKITNHAHKTQLTDVKVYYIIFCKFFIDF